jgi:hypothetical protein
LKSHSLGVKAAVRSFISERVPLVSGVRFGVNPNSSSLGVDVTYLLFGGTFAVATSLVLSAWLRVRGAKSSTPDAS